MMSEIHQNKTPEEIKQIIGDKLTIYKLWDPNFRVEEAHIELKKGTRYVPESPTYSAISHYIVTQGKDPDKFKIERYIGMSRGEQIYNFINLVELA